jgi:hypothetical protein
MALRILKVVNTITGSPGSPPDYNVMHFIDVAATTASAQAIVQVVADFYTAIKAYYGGGVIVTAGATVYQDPPGFNLLVPTAPVAVSGTDLSGYTAPQLAVVVSWRTMLATRTGRGRTFLGPLGRASETTNGTPTPAMVTTMQTAANNLIANTNALSGGASYVVYSPKLGTQQLITSALVRGGTFHTQRRRAVK